MIEQDDCSPNILTSWTINILGVSSQFTKFNVFSPELLLSCTPIGDIHKRVAYFSQVNHQGLSIVFSRDRQSPTREILELSISGGNLITRLNVLSEFESYLGKRQEQEGWQSIFKVSSLQIDMSRWNVVLSG